MAAMLRLSYRAMTCARSANSASANGQIAGVEPQYNEIRYLPLKQGRWLNYLDETQKRNVIVLGDELTRNLFLDDPRLVRLSCSMASGLRLLAV